MQDQDEMNQLIADMEKLEAALQAETLQETIREVSIQAIVAFSEAHSANEFACVLDIVLAAKNQLAEAALLAERQRLISNTYARSQALRLFPSPSDNNRIATTSDSSSSENSVELTRNSSSSRIQHTFHMLIVGDVGVGKTKLTGRFVQQTYTPVYDRTLLSDLSIVYIAVKTTPMKLFIWDLPAGDHNQFRDHIYLPNIHGLLLCFDLTNRRSFTTLQYRLDAIRKTSKRDVTLILVGTKSDLSAERSVSREEIDQWIIANGNMTYCETSARYNSGVDDAFAYLANGMRNTSLASISDAAAAPDAGARRETGCQIQ